MPVRCSVKLDFLIVVLCCAVLCCQAEAIYCSDGSEPLHFCLQCGKLEPLNAFDANKR